MLKDLLKEEDDSEEITSVTFHNKKTGKKITFEKRENGEVIKQEGEDLIVLEGTEGVLEAKNIKVASQDWDCFDKCMEECGHNQYCAKKCARKCGIY